jgi:hypothetical protein
MLPDDVTGSVLVHALLMSFRYTWSYGLRPSIRDKKSRAIL